MSIQSMKTRRGFLRHALHTGLLVSVSRGLLPSAALALGDISPKLPPGRSIYKLKGRVSVDRKPANLDTQIGANALIQTGDSSQLIFAVGEDAFILRDNSELQLGGEGELIRQMRIFSGKLLSVFGKRTQPSRIQTTTATIGIRGTGVYVEAEQDRSYVCTCYGHTLISASADPRQQVEVTTRHHDSPYYILAGNSGSLIRPAPVINHSDVELELIEQLVGRQAPFDPDEEY